MFLVLFFMPKLTEEQKKHNRLVGKIRIFVENALAGLKRYKILVHDFRNKRDNFVDDTIAICLYRQDTGHMASVHADPIAPRNVVAVSVDGASVDFVMLGPDEAQGYEAGRNVPECRGCHARIEACICKK